MQNTTKPEKAVALFNNGFNCAQAVLTAFAPELGLDEQVALKIAAGFGGGMGRTGNACGALTGAIMVLGMKYGSPKPFDRDAKTYSYEQSRILVNEFKKRTGATRCNDLLGFDMLTPQGQQAAKQPGAFDRCDDFVKIAAELVEQMI